MKTGPDRQRRTPSAPRGKTMQQRMAEARIRRAEVLAANDPANDDARLSKSTAKPDDTLSPTPARETAAAPSKETRFPAIVMPSETPNEAKGAKSKRRSGWLPFMVLALLAAIVGTLFLLPPAKAPLTTQSVTTPKAPEQTSSVTRPALDSPAARAETIMALLTPPLSPDPMFPIRLQRAITGIQNTAAVTASLDDGIEVIAPIIPRGQAPLLSIRPAPRGTGIDMEQMSKDIESVVRTATQ